MSSTCSSCGSELVEGARFCSACGASAAVVPPPIDLTGGVEASGAGTSGVDAAPVVLPTDAPPFDAGSATATDPIADAAPPFEAPGTGSDTEMPVSVDAPAGDVAPAAPAPSADETLVPGAAASWQTPAASAPAWTAAPDAVAAPPVDPAGPTADDGSAAVTDGPSAPVADSPTAWDTPAATTSWDAAPVASTSPSSESTPGDAEPTTPAQAPTWGGAAAPAAPATDWNTPAQSEPTWAAPAAAAAPPSWDTPASPPAAAPTWGTPDAPAAPAWQPSQPAGPTWDNPGTAEWQVPAAPTQTTPVAPQSGWQQPAAPYGAPAGTAQGWPQTGGTPAATPKGSGGAPLGGLLLIVGGAALVIGSFLDWAEALVNNERIVLTGFKNATGDLWGGPGTIALGAILALMGLVYLAGAAKKRVPAVVKALTVVVALTAVGFVAYLLLGLQLQDTPANALIGLWLALAGSLLGLVGSFFGRTKKVSA